MVPIPRNETHMSPWASDDSLATLNSGLFVHKVPSSCGNTLGRVEHVFHRGSCIQPDAHDGEGGQG
jgi:hypothetical protein